ncbi:chemotaxis response regulator protein-glutamate methylesterase [Bacillus spongiae]|uniref:Protein-glutamate methylesterase/protein-glutamine glutaminase n=1 Tax=Bacillus spongiae TaxID=2683610 RepID=A0ABU8HAJ2_9BACI
MKKKKVLIVDDSAFMRKLIQNFIAEHPLLESVGIARNGKEAIEKIKRLTPDVVSLDVEMPILNGLDALQQIMKECPVPIIMLSSTTKKGAENAILAMSYGAVDFIAKPSGTISLDLGMIKDEFITKLLSASTIEVSKLNQSSAVLKQPERKTKFSHPLPVERKKRFIGNIGTNEKKIVCIGTSTGGPRALQQVLTSLPEDFKAPILVVQHMPAGFTQSLAARLNTLANIHIKEAEDGDVLENGTAYIAPGGFHLKLKRNGSNLAIVLDNSEAPRNGHRPSVDVMFEAIKEYEDYEKIAVIMTGMGSDGAEGLVKLKMSGTVKAIAESKDSSIVYGMPKAALSTKMVDDVEPLKHIADAIMNYMP